MSPPCSPPPPLSPTCSLAPGSPCSSSSTRVSMPSQCCRQPSSCHFRGHVYFIRLEHIM